jgi:hypothetical protein
LPRHGVAAKRPDREIRLGQGKAGASVAAEIRQAARTTAAAGVIEDTACGAADGVGRV